MIPFTESLRYEYPLTKESIVLDVGAYEGNFALMLVRKYGCRVHAFEPVPQFFWNALTHVAECPAITMYPFGLHRDNCMMDFKVKGCMTGAFSTGEESVQVMLCSVVETIKLLELPPVIDLIKLNIEGLEYEVLEAILDTQIARRFRNIQVQFHSTCPDFKKRFDVIESRLSETHFVTWRDPSFDTGWVNYQLK